MAWVAPKTNWDTVPTNPVPADFNRIEGNILQLNTDVATGKTNLYNAIVAKGITPGSQAFADLVNAIATATLVDTADANAIAAQILANCSAYIIGSKVNGTMPNRAGDTAAVASSVSGTTLKLLASNGYRDGVDDNVTITDANFIASNLLAEHTYFGLEGTYVEQVFVASDNVLYQDPSQGQQYSVTPAKMLAILRFNVTKAGTLRVKFRTWLTTGTGGVGHVQIYKNGLAAGSGKTLAKTEKNFINCNLFNMANLSIIGWLISEGKILSHRDEYKTWRGNPKGTLIVYRDGTVFAGLKLDSEIVKEMDKIWFCTQGFNLFPLDIKKEGFDPATVGYSTNRMMIGYDGKEIVITYRPKTDASRAVQTMTNLGCKMAISLDSGLSSNMVLNGETIITSDRVLPCIITF